MASIDAVGHVLVDGVRYYHFNVVFDTENWIVTKCYDDFVALRKEMEDFYSVDQLPYLTGEVRPWAKNSEKTADSRQPKLEVFLMELLVTKFQPDIFDVNIPFMSRNIKDYRISKFAFEFLEFASQYKPHSSPTRGPNRNSDSGGGNSPVPEGGASTPSQQGNHSTSQHPAASEEDAEKKEEERLAKEREAEIKRLLQKQKASAAAIAKSTEAVGRTSITNQMKVLITSFEIFERDRIDYIVSIELWDRTWSVSKRYSDFVDLYNELLSVYGGSSSGGDNNASSSSSPPRRVNAFKASDVPPPSRRGGGGGGGGVFSSSPSSPTSPKCVVRSIEASKAPFYKKLDPETGTMRQHFFQQYLQQLVLEIDSWEPKGLMATFAVQAAAEDDHDTDGGGGAADGDRNADGSLKKKKEQRIINVSVSVNKVLFDFFNFQEHMSTINAYVARKVLARQSEKLPESVKKAMAAKLEAERRLKVISELQHRQRTRTVIDDRVVNEFLDLLPLLQEDRDVINSIRYLTEYGAVCRDLRELDAIYGIGAIGGAGKGATGSAAGNVSATGKLTAMEQMLTTATVNPFFSRGEIGGGGALSKASKGGKGTATSSSTHKGRGQSQFAGAAHGGNNRSFAGGGGVGGESLKPRDPKELWAKAGRKASMVAALSGPSGATGIVSNSSFGGAGGAFDDDGGVFSANNFGTNANFGTHANFSTNSNFANNSSMVGGGGRTGLRVGTRRLAGANTAASERADPPPSSPSPAARRVLGGVVPSSTRGRGGSEHSPLGSARPTGDVDDDCQFTTDSGRGSGSDDDNASKGSADDNDDEDTYNNPKSPPSRANNNSSGGGSRSMIHQSVTSNPATDGSFHLPARPSAPIGISSTQAARIAESIYFNDTRRCGIQALAAAIVDDRYWGQLFETLIYEWEESRLEVEEVLIKAHGDREIAMLSR